ncbi:lipoprotein insertase outer membrane protein LolB [Sinimarinibacterium thermocellulolyticum]|uniref:Outer-membrane lipoprotein LolB n=1 Tax=Sinimarinibacterium thermocellulolyticum TaxID=3170016 RepID=A0ABV2ABG7_9GAMM
MKRALTGVVAVLAAACAPLNPPPSPAERERAELHWARHREALSQVLGFSLQGRLADDRGRSGELSWQQRADGSFALQLRGPFGAGGVAIDGDVQRVRVRTKHGEQLTEDPRSWMREQLGWDLPLDDLRDWVLGLPAQGPVEALVLDAEGRLAQLQQHGWSVRYERYQRVGALQLPQRLDAESGDIRLRLLVDRWTAIDLAAAPDDD